MTIYGESINPREWWKAPLVLLLLPFALLGMLAFGAIIWLCETPEETEARTEYDRAMKGTSSCSRAS